MNAPRSTYRLISGVSLLLMAIISPIGLLVALPAGLFGVTAAVALLVVVLDVIAALAMYPVITSGGRILGITATVLRCAYALGLLIAAVALIFSQDASQFSSIWDQSLAIFGVHLILVGVLLCLSSKLRTIVGILVGIRGIGYLVAAVAVFLGSPNPGVSEFTFVGEVVLFIWLIYSGPPCGRKKRPCFSRSSCFKTCRSKTALTLFVYPRIFLRREGKDKVPCHELERSTGRMRL